MPQNPELRRRDLAILGAMGLIVAALLVLGVNKVREAANRMLCGSNLRQLGIACHNYHSDYKRFPPGYYGPVVSNGQTAPYDPDRGPWVGFLPPVLVYDGSGDFKYLWNTPQTYPLPESSPQRPRPIGLALNVERRAWWTVPKNLAKIGRVPNRVLRCPSDDALFDPPAVGVLLTIHVSGSGQGFTAVTGPANLGATSYTGVAGAAGWFVGTTPAAQRFGPWEGVLTNRSKVELGHFPKGGANTLLIGEGLGGTGVGGRDYTWSWIGVGALGTVYGLGRPTVPAAPAPPEYGETPPDGADGAAWYRFSSWHPHGVQFCFADCSVRGLRFGTTTQPDSADWQLLQLLAARQGPAVTPADLGE